MNPFKDLKDMVVAELEALARDGKNHQAILAWYYPGAAIVKAYG